MTTIRRALATVMMTAIGAPFMRAGSYSHCRTASSAA